MPHDDLPDSLLLDIALEAAQAGCVIIRAQSAGAASLEWSEKAAVDFVTEVDREAEVAIASVIRHRAPPATVVGEELSPELGTLRGITFIVDPIDGTTNFIHGYPEYAVSIGVARDGQLVAGVIVNIPVGETFTCLAGGGSYRDGNPIAISSVSMARRALIGTGFPYKHHEYADRYLQQMRSVILNTSGIRRAGSAALDLADVACGRLDGFWELSLAPWDVAAGILLVREAGGIVTDLAGGDAQLAHTSIVAGNPAIHGWLLDVLEKADLSVSRASFGDTQ